MIRFIYGRNSVQEAIKNDLPISKLYVTNLQRWSDTKLPIEVVSKGTLDAMANHANHQGVIAILSSQYNYHDIASIVKDKPPRILVLDHLQDPYNFGAIIRSAAAFDFKYIIIPRDRSVKVTPLVEKVASGGANQVKIVLVKSLYEAVKNLKWANNYWVYAACVSALATRLETTIFNEPLIVIVGSEKSGISSTLTKLADQQVYIPIDSQVESLNVSVASGILLFYLKNIKKT